MRLFKRSNGFYYIKVSDEFGNEIRRISTRKKRKSEALQFLYEYENTLKEQYKSKNIHLGKFKHIYLEYVQNSKSKSYQRNIINSFNFLFTVYNDQTNLDSIQVNKIEHAFIELFSKSKYAGHTYQRILKSAFNKAISWNYITQNPFCKFKLPKVEKNVPLFINHDELNFILTNITNPNLKDIYQLLFHTGLRISECLNLKWNDINFNEISLKVSNKKDFTTKNKKERIIPMNNTVLEILIQTSKQKDISNKG